MTIETKDALSGVVAGSPAMRELIPLLARLAEAKSPVLLEGESGTGKDLVAHWLHYGGPRREPRWARSSWPPGVPSTSTRFRI